MLAEQHNNGKLVTSLLIVKTGLIAYQFWRLPIKITLLAQHED